MNNVYTQGNVVTNSIGSIYYTLIVIAFELGTFTKSLFTFTTDVGYRRPPLVLIHGL